MSNRILRLTGVIIIGVGLLLTMLGMQGLFTPTIRTLAYALMIVGSIVVILDSYVKGKRNKAKWGDGEDLTHLDGIGPKIANILKKNGIMSYRDLSARTPDELAEMLQAANFTAPFDPTSWPVQADLAAKSRWYELEKLQKSLREEK